jgi:hypothetical protein
MCSARSESPVMSHPTRASVTMITVETVARGYGRLAAAATGHRANRRLEHG